MDARVMKTLEKYDALKRNMRHYDHQAWHAVNVKRYNDYISDIPALIADIHCPDECRDELITYVTEYAIDYDAYDLWIEDIRDQLQYELNNLDEHTDLKYIKWLDDMYLFGTTSPNYVYFLGNSGGWACFQDTGETIIEYFNPDDSDHTPEEINEFITELEACIEEIEYVKNYISRMNDGIKWSNEVHFRAEQKADELVDQWENIIDERSAILAGM